MQPSIRGRLFALIEVRLTAILLSSAILLALHRIAGWKDLGVQFGSGLESSVFMFVMAFILLGVGLDIMIIASN